MQARVRQPFDFTSDFPFRIDLYERGEGRLIAHVIAQHIVYDMVSMMTLLREIIELIAVYHVGVEPLHRVPDADDFLSDFVSRERALRGDDRGRAMRERWREAIGQASLSPTYPLQQPKTHYRLVPMRVAISGEDARALTARAQEYGVTAFSWLFTMWQVALGAQLGDRDFLIGTTLSLRNDPRLRDTIGPVTNYMAMRADLRAVAPMSVVDYVAATQARMIAAMADGMLPLAEQLSHRLSPDQVRFGLGTSVNYYAPQTIEQGGVIGAMRRGEHVTLGELTLRNSELARALEVDRLYDTMLSIIHWPDQLDVSLRYHPERLDERDAHALRRSLRALDHAECARSRSLSSHPGTLLGAALMTHRTFDSTLSGLSVVTDTIEEDLVPEVAIILAAGCGSRLGLARPVPKCLVEIGGRTLLQHQLGAFARAGIERAVIIVGFEAERVIAHATSLGQQLGVQIECRTSDTWRSTNTLVSMALAADVMRACEERGCYTANGDVLFDDRLIDQITRAEGETAIAIEASRCAEEEVKVSVDASGRIQQISKQVDVHAALGESVGIARYRGDAVRAFADMLEEMAPEPDHARDYFEHALEAIAPDVCLRAVVLDDAPVIEIDFPQDLERAERVVLPSLIQAEQA